MGDPAADTYQCTEGLLNIPRREVLVSITGQSRESRIPTSEAIIQVKASIYCALQCLVQVYLIQLHVLLSYTMTSPPYRILIFGATGAIGKYISGAIISADPPVGRDISIFTSDATPGNPDKLALLSAWQSRGVRVLTGDASDTAAVSGALEAADVVISCLGRDALALQTDLLRLAELSPSVKWFFPSEYGTDIEYDASSKDEIPHQNKLQVRHFIRSNIKRVKCTHLVTGPYIDMYLDLVPNFDRLGGYDVGSRRASVIGDGNYAVGFTTMREYVPYSADR
jgi:hypothetical protein